MKNLIILLSFIILNIGSYAQTNVIVKSITKKVTKESSEKILKKTAKEASEEIGEKSIKKISEGATDPIQKRIIRKAAVNNYNKTTLNSKKKSSLNHYKEKLSKNNNKKFLTLGDWRLIRNIIDNDDRLFLCKIFNTSPEKLDKVIKHEITDQINYHPDIDLKKSMYLVKQRIKELKTNPNTIELLQNEDFIINENTLFHLFARHGDEYKFLSFEEVIGIMKEIKNKGIKKISGNNITYTYKKQKLIFRDSKPKPYVISMYSNK